MKIKLLTILSAALLTTTLTSSAADNIFMQVADIPGTATEANHDRWHPLVSVDWSVERLVDMTDVLGRGAGGPIFSKIEITRQYDFTTPKFFISVVDGTVRPEIVLHFTQWGGSASGDMQTYMTIKLKHAVIDSLAQSVTEDGAPQETISIAYRAIEIETFKVDPITEKITIGNTARWDLATGQSY